jgi:hypothetical protein
MGVDEDTLLKELPAALRSDVYVARYAEIVNKSGLFKIDNEVDSQLTSSIFRMIKI